MHILEKNKAKIIAVNAERALSPRSGQALLLTVIVIGATILSATAFVSLLMLYQIRGATDIANSQRAIVAADAGLECQMYDEFNAGSTDCSRLSFRANPSKASVSVSCSPVNCTATSSVTDIVSQGSYAGASRVLELSF